MRPTTTATSKRIKETVVGYIVPTVLPKANARPFLKWAGGKWQLLSAFKPFFPRIEKVRDYYEPFIGGAAVFFYLQPPHAYLSDSNPDLIELYQLVRDNVEALIEALRKHQNNEDYYYAVRAQNSRQLTPVERAARFIFLNKTCYNGLYRVNSQGQFNVPFGNYKKPNICDVEGLQAASRALQNATLQVSDFEDAVASAGANDFVYFDPPYQPLNKTSSFTSYTAERFDETGQARLASVYRELDRRGCRLMLSNSDTPVVRELYRGFRIIEVLANRAINSKATGRGKITELLVTNY